MVPRFVLQLLFLVKIQLISNNSTTTEAQNTISTDVESLELKDVHLTKILKQLNFT
jgi:hypothetical protein